jgi:hypothetical protein
MGCRLQRLQVGELVVTELDHVVGGVDSYQQCWRRSC